MTHLTFDYLIYLTYKITMNKILKLLVLFVLSLCILTNGERTKDKMYEYIESAAACFRRLNGTHQTGCTSKRPGSTGVIHVINNNNETNDLNFVLKDGPAPPYIPIISIDHLSHKLINQFKQYSDRIAGIVLHRNITRPDRFSHELSCPNENSNLEGSCSSEKPWNPFGTSLMYANIPFPIFIVQDEQNLQKIVDCFERFNNFDLDHQSMRALCALELAAFMFATNDSHTCTRRWNSVTNFTPTRFCDPLGSRNIWGTLQPRISKNDVILVTAQLDSTTMFYDVTPGAVAPLTGLVTLMTTSYILKQMLKEQDDEMFNKTIMFAMFNGESYDYIGSQRFVYDIVNNVFPMKQNDEIKNPLPKMSLSDIQLIVELGQLNMNSKPDLFMHHIQYKSSKQIEKFKKIISKHAQNFEININEPLNSEPKRLPPASLQSFLRERETIEGVVLATHDQSFTNEFYRSIYDDSININNYKYQNGSVIPNDSIQQYIANISMILAQSLFEEISGKELTKFGASISPAKIVDELFHCYLDTANCSLHKAVTLNKNIPAKPLGLYVSVDPNGNKMTELSALIFSWLTGDITNLTRSNCTADPQSPMYNYLWMSKNLTNINDTACFKTTMHFSVAMSPAFEIDNYDWKSNRYSTWTESVWNDIYMRMFLVPSHRHEIMTICVGTVTFVLSLALVYFMHTRADILFAKPDAITPGTSC